MTLRLMVLDETLTDLLDRAASARRLANLIHDDAAGPRLEQLAEDLDAQIARYVRQELRRTRLT
nr:hypothetical protein [uncultured Rhodopila sp.]